MKKRITILSILYFLLIFFYVSGQTALEKAMNTMNVSMNIPSFWDISQNENSIDVISSSVVLDTTLQQTQAGETFKMLFGNVHAVIRHKNAEYVIFVYAGGEGALKYANLINQYDQLFNVINLSFNRIKRDLRYGIRHKSATSEEIAVLDTMIIHYPKAKVEELFNADWMVSYPMDLREEAYENKYSQCKAVSIAKNGLGIFFYFMLTDETENKFENYLEDLKGAFWYNE